MLSNCAFVFSVKGFGLIVAVMEKLRISQRYGTRISEDCQNPCEVGQLTKANSPANTLLPGPEGTASKSFSSRLCVICAKLPDKTTPQIMTQLLVNSSILSHTPSPTYHACYVLLGIPGASTRPNPKP